MAQQNLSEVHPTPHFEIHYALRNPALGRGESADGVHDISVVHQYADTLEFAYQRITKNFGWSPLSSLPVPVYIHAIRRAWGLATPKRSGGPRLEFTNFGAELTPQDAKERRAASAAHELTHLFVFEFGLPLQGEWEWLHEGIATGLESHILPENTDYFRYLWGWFTQPERSIDASDGYGASAAFVRYLIRRYDAEVVPEVCSRGASAPSAIEALADTVVGRGNAFDEVVVDYFADAYFLCDLQSRCHNPSLQSLHGDRAVTKSFDTYPVKNAASRDPVDPLGCRYYRFRPVDSKSRLEVTVELPSDEAKQHLRGELVGVDAQMRRTSHPSASLARSSTPDKLTGTLNDFTPAQLDHAVLILSNCAYGRGAGNAANMTFSISADVF